MANLLDLGTDLSGRQGGIITTVVFCSNLISQSILILNEMSNNYMTLDISKEETVQHTI